MDPALLRRTLALVERGGRLLGITGPPGSGKSSLASAVATAATEAGLRACVLAMDGYHLADEELDRLGRHGRKGAPDTFDVEGYLSALRRVRARDHDVLVPRFHREIEAAVAGAVRIPIDATLVVTEGNYLLLGDERWAAVRPLLDECWMLEPDDGERVARLVARHESHGRSPDAARAWVHNVDERNTALIRARSTAPDLVIAAR